MIKRSRRASHGQAGTDAQGKRRFGRSERVALGLVQGVSPDGLHADHVVPFSAGGATDVANGQLITARANMAKGSKSIEWRAWQSNMIEAWESRSSADFLVVAIPGSGKTLPACEVVRRWLSAGSDRAVIVVVPSTNLRDQWQGKLSEFGIEIVTQEFDGHIKHGYRGCAVTYQTVASSPLVFRAACGRRPTLVIFDEIHHCGEYQTWGESIQSAFELSKERLFLSGTPFRTDGKKIPFLSYDESGLCRPDVAYDLPAALEDQVVRWVHFHAEQGSFDLYKDGSQQTFDVNSGIDEDEAGQRLRHILNPDGNYVREVIRKAHAQLCSMRTEHPEAAGMIGAMDIQHARALAMIVRQVTGETPDVIASDEPGTSDRIKSFAQSKRHWLVSVRQVSEGTDIPRLRVLVYLTNYATELFFRQIVGRVTRLTAREQEADPEGANHPFESWCFIPSDPRLARFAENIMRAQEAALRDYREPEERGERERPEQPMSAVFLGSSGADTEFVIIGGQRFTVEQSNAIRECAARWGVSPDAASAMLQTFGPLFSRNVQPSAPTCEEKRERQAVPLEVVEKQKRKQVHRLVHILHLKTGEEHKVIHFRTGGGTPQPQMTVEQLEAKVARLKAEIEAANARLP